MDFDISKFGLTSCIILTLLGCQDRVAEVSKPLPKPDTSPPYVKSQLPISDQEDIIDTTDIQVTFSEPVNKDTVNNDSFSIISEHNTGVDGIVSYDT